MKSLLRKIYRKIRVEDGAILDICTACRSNCMYCLHQYKNMVKSALMPFPDYIDIVWILHREHFKNIFLYQSGEPFLHPDIYKMIELASSYKFKIYIATRLNCEIEFKELDNIFKKEGSG